MQYFGQLTKISLSGYGRITVLARLRREGDHWVQEESFNVAEKIGRTSKVSLQRPISTLGLADRMLVRFDIAPNPQPVDGLNNDTFIVADRLYSLSPAIERFGAFVVKEEEANWRREPRWIKGVPDDAIVYIYSRTEKALIGPWRVQGKEQCYSLWPKDGVDLVYRYPRSKIDPLSFVQLRESSGARECIIAEPPQAIAEPVDLAGSIQRANWLLEQLPRASGALAQALRQLDEQLPDWKNQLRSHFKQFADETERKIARNRWERAEEILNYLDLEQRNLAHLQQNPLFQKKWEQAVAQHRALICQQAEQESAAFCAAEQQKRERQQMETVRIVDELKQKIADEEQLLELIQEENAKQDTKLHQDKVQLLQAAEYLREQQNCLVQQFIGFQALLKEIDGQNRETEKTGPVQSVRQGEPIDNQRLFIEQRLLPGLLRWLPEVNHRRAELFHYTLLACRAVLVPNCAWALGYQEAMGATAQVQIHTVEPTWLRFADAFSEELKRFWEAAVQENADCLYLLVLQDINRALPECWARPLFNVLAGLQRTLDAAGCLRWPPNLRLLATVADDEAGYSLADQVTRYFAAVQLDYSGQTLDRAPLFCEGYVPLAVWQDWCGSPAEPPAVLPPEFQSAGPAARLIATEVLQLEKVLERFGAFEDPAYIARRIRWHWPEDYRESARRGDK